jgi:hypothetical protein
MGERNLEELVYRPDGRFQRKPLSDGNFALYCWECGEFARIEKPMEQVR